jgi:hypothetical protein
MPIGRFDWPPWFGLTPFRFCSLFVLSSLPDRFSFPDPLTCSTRMVYAMDTLGYAKRLRDAGVPQQQAEAHAEAARDFVMGELVTKTDLQATVNNAVQLLEARIAATQADVQNAMQVAKSDLHNAVQVLETKIGMFETRLEAKIDAQTPRLTVRLGGIMAAGIALLAAVQKLT